MAQGGAGLLQRGVGRVTKLFTSAIVYAGTTLSFTAAQFNQIMAAFGAISFDRGVKIAIKPLVGATIHAGVVAWQNPEAVSIVITRALVDVTTVATGAA